MKKKYLFTILLLSISLTACSSPMKNLPDFTPDYGADIITVNKTDYFYKDSELEDLICEYLVNSYNLESPKITRISRHHTEGGIAGITNDYTFNIKDSGKKFKAEYMSIGGDLTRDYFKEDDFELYDSKGNLIEPTKNVNITTEIDIPDTDIKSDWDLNYETEYTNVHVTLTKNNGKYYLTYEGISKDPEYDSFNDGPYEGELDEETYNRLSNVLTYLEDNKDEFDRKAAKYSKLNMASPDSTTLMDFALVWYALTVDEDEQSEDSYVDTRWEADNYLEDMEQIIAHEDNNDYYVYTSIYSSFDSSINEKAKVNEYGQYCVYNYYNEEDGSLRIVDYDTYMDTWNFYTNGANPKFTDENSEYAIKASLGFNSWVDLWVDSMSIENGVLSVDLYNDLNGIMADGGGAFLVIPVPKGTKLGNVTVSGPSYKDDHQFVFSEDKPVVYLYNYNEDVNVKISIDKGELTCTYPKYTSSGWNIKATPDGHLIDKDGKTYRYLYWEGEINKPWLFNKGFCVKGSETAEFLEKALEEQGLSDDEINEFIIYWLPLMQNNKYNVISFQTKEYTDSTKLEVNPSPDTMIRVFMTWYPSEEEINIESQTFVKTERFGRTVVEWGGSKVK